MLRLIYTPKWFKPQMSSPGPASKPATILIVDDDALHLQLYAWILQRRGHNCILAQVKSESLDLPPNGDVDLVLLDYRFNSSLSTMDVFDQIRSRFPSAPVVVLSDRQWMPDDMKGKAEAFVSKGDPNVLLDTVATILDRRSANAG